MQPPSPKTLCVVTQALDSQHPILGFFHSWILEFAAHFDEVHVICLEKGEVNLPPHVRVYSLGKEDGVGRLTYVWRFYRSFHHIFFHHQPQYVLFHMGAIFNILAAPFFWLRRRNPTHFYWWKTHGHINVAGRLALRFVDRVYTAVDESFAIATPKRRTIGHAIDSNLFQLADKRPSTLRLLFVGRRSRSKRLEQVIAVAEQLVESGVPLSLHIIGAVVDEAYEQEWQEVLRQSAVASHTVVKDGVPQSELVTAYQSAHILLNPSDNDGLDKVVLEGMLCGALPLSANRSFMTLLGQFGLFMQKGDIDGYVQCINELRSLPESAAFELRLALREEVVANHALDTLTERIFSE